MWYISQPAKWGPLTSHCSRFPSDVRMNAPLRVPTNTRTLLICYSPFLWAGVRSPRARAIRLLLVFREFFPQLARAIYRLAGTEIVHFEHLANLYLAFLSFAVRRGHALRPFDRFFLRLHLDNPVAGYEFLCLGEGPVDHGPLASRDLDARALRARLEARQVNQRPGFHQFFVI